MVAVAPRTGWGDGRCDRIEPHRIPIGLVWEQGGDRKLSPITLYLVAFTKYLSPTSVATRNQLVYGIFVRLFLPSTWFIHPTSINSDARFDRRSSHASCVAYGQRGYFARLFHLTYMVYVTRLIDIIPSKLQCHLTNIWQ